MFSSTISTISVDLDIGVTPAQSNLAPFGLPDSTALDLATVFEMLTDELEVLGRSLPVPAVELRSEESVLHAKDFNRPVFKAKCDKETPKRKNSGEIMRLSPASSETAVKDQCYLLQQHYCSVLPRRIQDHIHPYLGEQKRRDLNAILKEAGVKTNNEVGKLQADRVFLQLAAMDILSELMQTSSYQSLMNTLANEKAKKENAIAAFTNVYINSDRLTQLKKEIKLVKASKLSEVKELRKAIWGLRDQLLEIGILKERETRYVERHCKSLRHRSKLWMAKKDRKIEELYNREKPKVDNEHRVHYAMVQIIQKYLSRNEELLDYWTGKFDVDLTDLQARLDQMKKDRLRDQNRAKWLITWIKNYQEIVDDDRRIKELRLQRERRRALETKSAIKIQAVWRGTMVRKKLGPFKPTTDKKGKKDDKNQKDKKDKKRK